MPERRIAVVGIAGDALGKDATRALERAELVVGGRRHLDALAPSGARRVAIGADIEGALDAVAGEPGAVCVLASGDPGFFGIVRRLAERFGPAVLEVHPAPSSVALAFARAGLPWDDAVVVSAHGRPLDAAARVAAGAAKAAVLTGPDARPEHLGRELVRLGATHGRAVVCSHLGEPDEAVVETDLAGLAAGSWDPLSVVLLLAGLRDPNAMAGLRGPNAMAGLRGPNAMAGMAVATAPVLAWGLPDHRFDHRNGMVTKAEVRAVALGKLALPPAGVLWDVGAGSGSVAVECARLAPGLRVVAVERRPDDAARARANASAHRVALEVVEGEAPGCLAGLPDPDRVFVGGGGLAVLRVTVDRVRPGGRVVATYAALDRAAAAFEVLGHLVEMGVSRGEALPGGGVRLAAENPVFVVWGPDE